MLLPAKYYAIVAGLPGSVLLETSQIDEENSNSFLFVDPLRQLVLKDLREIPAFFSEIEDALREGLYVAGFMNYECGFHFEPKAQRFPLAPGSHPLAWFGVYERPFTFDHDSGRFTPELPAHCRELVDSELDSSAFSLSNSRLDIGKQDYCAKIEQVREYIAAGDTYQVNFTTKLKFDFSGRPESFLVALRDQQHVPYAAFINTGSEQMLSLSPELFFRIADGQVTLRPMKGTAPRGVNSQDDQRVSDWLRNDVKNRSENLMIVDLLRNDIGKVAETGSVQVDDLFTIEKYASLFQMTSSIRAKLRPGTSFYELFRAIFPCGSITGAPKVRTMQIIQELEKEPRGVYTGAIGFFSPQRDAVFSVAIRTIVLAEGKGELGVGGGIVYDSVPAGEYDECLLKGQFFRKPTPEFQLLESLLWKREAHLLDLHLERMRASAEYFAFPWDEARVNGALEQATNLLPADKAYKLRLLLDSAGNVRVESAPITAVSPMGTAVLSAIGTSSRNRFLYHKTTNRALYNSMYAEARRQGYDDVIFRNERGEITEGCINNIFIESGGKLFTPPVECGLLPGVERRFILEGEKRASEKVLHIEDLRAADAIYLANSVRGMRQVKLVEKEVTVAGPFEL